MTTRRNSQLQGFEVYDNATHEIMLDRYAVTDDGELLKQDAHGGWEKVPDLGEYLVIPYNHNGRGEVW